MAAPSEYAVIANEIMSGSGYQRWLHPRRLLREVKTAFGNHSYRMLVGGLSVVIIICNNFLICVRLFTDWLPDNGTIELLAMLLSFIFTSALAGPAVMITLNSMFADIADEQELLTGDRQEGRKASFFLLDHSRSRPVVHAQPSSVVSGLI